MGRASTELLADEGASLVISYRSGAEQAAAFQKSGRVIRADITQADDRRALLDAAPDIYGLVVFAGDPSRVTAPEEMESAMRRSMEVNWFGSDPARPRSSRAHEGTANASVLLS